MKNPKLTFFQFTHKYYPVTCDIIVTANVNDR
jgi:hypothetical protein